MVPPKPPSLQELTAVVVETSPAGSPLDRLAAAATVSQELARIGDELIGHFVDASRRSGCSWAEIGQTLGVTRQAAQQRFVAAGRGGQKMFERFGSSAQRAVDLAQHEASRLDHNYVGTEHLLLGLIAEGEGVAARALKALGITAVGIRARCEEIIGRGPACDRGPLPFSPRSKKVLQLAVEEAKAMGDEEVGTEHLLLGLLREGEGVAAQILAGEGADEQRTRLQVSAILGRPCAPAVRSRRRRAFGRSR